MNVPQISFVVHDVQLRPGTFPIKRKVLNPAQNRKMVLVSLKGKKGPMSDGKRATKSCQPSLTGPRQGRTACGLWEPPEQELQFGQKRGSLSHLFTLAETPGIKVTLLPGASRAPLQSSQGVCGRFSVWEVPELHCLGGRLDREAMSGPFY